VPQPWGQLYRRDHVLVLGMPGCGKTPFAAQLVESARRVVYWDPAHEMTGLGLGVEADDLQAYPEILAGRTCRVVVHPRTDELLRDFEATVRACSEAREWGGLVLLVDEVHLLSAYGDGAAILRELHAAGHKDGIATVFVSPCWTDIPARCRATASRVYSFAQIRRDDIDALTSELGRHVPEFGEQAAAWRHPSPPVAWVSPTLHA
jgi:hypothetical protein